MRKWNRLAAHICIIIFPLRASAILGILLSCEIFVDFYATCELQIENSSENERSTENKNNNQNKQTMFL